MESEIVWCCADVFTFVTGKRLSRVLGHLVPFEAGQLGGLVRAGVAIKRLASLYNRRSDSLVLGHLMPAQKD